MLGKLFRKKIRLSSSRIKGNFQKGLISVVLPVYNGEEYLAEAIESVQKQTRKEWELIIVNDGSTDNSLEIAKKYAGSDKRITVLDGVNRKLPMALNGGFAQAKGEFYTWTSADNRMLENCLEVLAAELENDDNLDMVIGNMRLIGQNGEVKRNHGWFEIPIGSGNVILPKVTPALNVVANNTIGAAFMYRCGTEAVLGGYSPNRYMLEDYDYFMQMNSIFHIAHTKCSQPIYEYRMHPKSLTARDTELGITRNRPKLMEFDKFRRKFYKQKIYIICDDGIKLSQRELAKAGLYKISKDGKDRLSGRVIRLTVNREVFNAEKNPTYIIEERQVFFNNIKYNSLKSVSFDNEEDLILFIRHRAECDLLYLMEQKN